MRAAITCACAASPLALLPSVAPDLLDQDRSSWESNIEAKPDGRVKPVVAMPVMVAILGLSRVIATRLPLGVSWRVDAIRRTFLTSTSVFMFPGLHSTSLALGVVFKDRVFDDLCQSFGRSLSWDEPGSAINHDIPAWLSLVILAAAVGMLPDGHQLPFRVRKPPSNRHVRGRCSLL